MIQYSETLAVSNMIFPAPLLGILQGISDDIPRVESEKVERIANNTYTRGMTQVSIDLQEKILTIIRENGKIGSVAIGNMLGKTRFCIYSHCSMLVEYGKIKLLKVKKIYYWVAV
jgi:predicted HTH transcriptional regulator